MSGTLQHRHGLDGPAAAPGGSALVVRRETASQTAGPYVHIGLAPDAAGFDIFDNNFGSVLASDKTKGEQIRIEGRVFDGIGTVLKDVLIEIWQANAEGKYAHPGDRQPGKTVDPGFRGWGRGCTDFETGMFAFDTDQARHRSRDATVGAWRRTSMSGSSRAASTSASTRGSTSATRPQANANDAVLNLIEWEQRRQTLVAERLDRRLDNGAAVYRFDIRLQGESETVFFDV